MRFLKSMWQASRSLFRFFLVVMLGYLLHVCVMPYIKLGGVTPSLLFALIGIVTVGYGRQRTIWISCIYGILMEIMAPTLRSLNLLLYPISAMFLSFFFADKSDKRMQYERSLGEAGRNINALVRTMACAACNTLIYEVVNILYMYLAGAELTMNTLFKALLDIFWTTVLTSLIMVPVRRYLGFKKQNKEEEPRETPNFHIGRS